MVDEYSNCIYYTTVSRYYSYCNNSTTTSGLRRRVVLVRICFGEQRKQVFLPSRAQASKQKMVLAMLINNNNNNNNNNGQQLSSTTTLVVGALVTGVSLYYVSKRTSLSATGEHQPKKQSVVVPYASAGILASVKGMSGRDNPLFLLALAKEAKEQNGCVDGTFRLPLSPGGLYVIGSHKVARMILQDLTTDKAPQFYNPFNQMTGSKSCIFTGMKSEYHTMVRKSTRPAFSNKEIARMNSISSAVIEEWISKTAIPLAEGGKPFDPPEEMLKVVMKIICKAAFEYDISDTEHEAFVENMEKCLREYAFKQGSNPLRQVFGLLIKEVRDAKQSSKHTQEFAARVLEAYRQKKPNTKSDANTLIKLIATNDQYPSDADRIGEIILFLLAGHDTTGFTLGTTLTLLAKYPRVAEKLRSELKKVSRSSSSSSSSDKSCWATDCEYLKYVIKESMRLHPSAAINGTRKTGRAFETDDGRVIPKGATIFCLNAAFGRDERYFENPEEFNPDRWYNATEDMKLAVMNFSAGSRNCVGQSLAMAEINTIIPSIITEFSLELVKDGTPDYFLTWKLAGAEVRLKKL